MAAANNVLENLKEMPAGKQFVLLLVIAISVAGMVFFYNWIQKADYQVLYSNLSEEDSGRIAQELQTKNIPFQVGAGGALLVPSDKVYDVRLQLAGEGLPQGSGVGFEIFDNTSFTTSEFVQKLNYRRALEGELSRTIRTLVGVEQSRVHLAVPDKTLFALSANKTEASAAVFVTLANGRKLSSPEVRGIVHLVSSSVEDLRPESITVIDNRGELLTTPSGDDAISLSGTQMDYQHGFEKNIMSKVVSILEPVVGKGKVNARVSAEFDFTRSERTEEKFDPEGAVIVSEQKTTEKSSSGNPGGGIPGTDSNLPGRGSGASFSQDQSQKQDEMINYETSKTVTHVVESPITLERLTVAILIDGILPSQKDSIENADSYIVRSEENIKGYQDIVKKSIGFTEDRGDEISVSIMPFEKLEVPVIEEAPTDYMAIAMTVLKYVVPLIVALLFFLMVLKPLIKSLTAPPQYAAPGRALAGAQAAQLEAPLKTKEIPMEKQVIDWAAGNPQEAAGLVKGWLEEK
jgi:flagellar M-ring protein FliF